LSLSGDTVAPELIEEVLCGFIDVEQAAAFTLDDALGVSTVHALIVAAPNVDEAALRSYCQGKLREVFVPTRFFRVEDIPRVAQGKIDRQRVLDIGKAKAAQG
jgi:acyl-CoA synthetase (AMP-forming)/AMP-acid ligase II